MSLEKFNTLPSEQQYEIINYMLSTYSCSEVSCSVCPVYAVCDNSVRYTYGGSSIKEDLYKCLGSDRLFEILIGGRK